MNLKAQAVKDVVLRKLKDRLQRRGMSLQDYLVSKRKSMPVALTLRDFCKVRYEIRSESLNCNSDHVKATFKQCLKRSVLYIDSCHSCF